MIKKLIICDDDADILEMLEMVLEDTPFEVVTETDSRKVLDRVLNLNPDLLLMDLWMPGLSGDQVLKRLREDERTRETKVIIMSASRDGQSVAMAAGADGFIAKPFDIDALVDKISLS
ncbi:response regulator [Pedobacter deserti]|uniref:response regulator n=1 Tax=Pedobacter deserti TaxID=2817382 RepID=UPI00210DD116|nr:response regulator [Pedobacter sp. SYSU D00382]